MCMEDIKIGQKSYGNQANALISANWTPIIGPADNRISISFSSDSVNGFYVGTIVDNNIFGIFIPANSAMKTIDMTMFGRSVKKAWVGRTGGGNLTIAFIEALFDGVL